MALPIRDFVIQRLLEYDPSFDVGAGVPTTSLLIDPLSVILQPVIDELGVIQLSQSILSILETDDPDAFPEDIVDGLASNAFVERNPGSIGSDVMRVRFFAPQEFSAAQGVQVFRGAGSQRYTNSESLTVTTAEMSLNQEGSLYFVDVPIIALEEGDAFNVDAGSITTMEAEPQGVANVTNLFGVSQGADRETNTELIDRIKVAVTVRALVTGRGIIVTLTETFTTIEEITPIGFGDAEMMRDIVYNVHIGGNVDVYIKTAAFTAASQDFFGLEVDVSRRKLASSTVTVFADATAYSLGRSPIDTSVVNPTVKSLDGFAVYSTPGDYIIDETFGTISKTGASGIFHTEGTLATISTTKRLVAAAAGEFDDARPGMCLTITTPGSVSGAYSIKEKISGTEVEIYGVFPTTVAGTVGWKLDEVLVVAYEYNPVTVDVIKDARAVDREPFTILDTPFMQIVSVEVLDSLSGEPTGALLDSVGGYGSGGYGTGGYGVGGGADFRLVVEEPTLRHSELENNYIEFSQIHAGISVRVNYEHASAIPPIQAFMEDRNEQSQSADLLARHYIPVYVDATEIIGYSIPISEETTAITVDEMTVVVKDYVDDVDSGNDMQISDVVDILYNNGATRVDLGSLESFRGEIHNHDGSVIFTLPDDQGAVTIPNDPISDPSDKPLSSRIARFRARNITLERTLV
jgi:hypothetical protein